MSGIRDQLIVGIMALDAAAAARGLGRERPAHPKAIHRGRAGSANQVPRKMERRQRVLLLRATLPNERLSVDFVSKRLLDGRWFRVLTVVDQFTRECVLLLADSSLNGHKVALALSQAIAETRCADVDHGR
jgi:transposase InsO family protein